MKVTLEEDRLHVNIQPWVSGFKPSLKLEWVDCQGKNHSTTIDLLIAGELVFQLRVAISEAATSAMKARNAAIDKAQEDLAKLKTETMEEVKRLTLFTSQWQEPPPTPPEPPQ